MKKIFEYQIWHVILLGILIALILLARPFVPNLFQGALWNVETATWFWVAIGVPVLHQLYVWLIWRLELYRKTFTRKYGPAKAFRLYKGGFSILMAGRLVLISFVAVSNRLSFSMSPVATWTITALLAALTVYVFYSVIRFFTLARAYGIDHFDSSYDAPFERRGVYRFTNNAMYLYAMMGLYLPGLVSHSSAALVVALFNHLFIWGHYFCTERPDMKQIYGDAPH